MTGEEQATKPEERHVILKLERIAFMARGIAGAQDTPAWVITDAQRIADKAEECIYIVEQTAGGHPAPIPTLPGFEEAGRD
jgi:hypothetical protein